MCQPRYASIKQFLDRPRNSIFHEWEENHHCNVYSTPVISLMNASSTRNTCSLNHCVSLLTFHLSSNVSFDHAFAFNTARLDPHGKIILHFHSNFSLVKIKKKKKEEETWHWLWLLRDFNLLAVFPIFPAAEHAKGCWVTSYRSQV